jgi:DNA-binding NtrC family response regulator
MKIAFGMKSPFKRIAHVLYVNDQKEDIARFSQAIQKWDTPHEVKVIEQVDEALRFLSSADSAPDIVIVNVGTDNGRGMEVIRKVRESEAIQGVPIIVMGTEATDEEICEAYNHYANCFIQTPKETGDMSRMLASLERFWFHVAFLPGFRKLQKDF